MPEQSDLERGESGSLVNGSADGEAAARKALLSNDGQHSEGMGAAEEAAAAADKRQRTVTTVLINLSAIMERTDEQLLPAVYRFVGESFQVSVARTMLVSNFTHAPAASRQLPSMHVCQAMKMRRPKHQAGWCAMRRRRRANWAT